MTTPYYRAGTEVRTSKQMPPPPPLSVTTTVLPAATVGVAYSAILAASGGVLPYTWSWSGTLPAGITLSTAGVFSGTPTAADSSSFSVTVTDGRPIASAPVTPSLTVNPGSHVTVTTTSLPTGTVGSPYSATLAATGGTPPYTWTYTGTLPAGIVLSTAGVFSGTPTAAIN